MSGSSRHSKGVTVMHPEWGRFLRKVGTNWRFLQLFDL